MKTAILPSINNAQVRVDVSVDRISEAFDVDEDQKKRCFYGVGAIHAFQSWKDAPVFDLWMSSQRVMISLEAQPVLWTDDQCCPMMGYVSGLRGTFQYFCSLTNTYEHKQLQTLPVNRGSIPREGTI